MADQQRSFQSVCKVDRRTLPIGLSVVLRKVQNIRGVLIGVVCPISDRSQCRTSCELIRFSEHCHQRDEPSVTATVKTNSFWIDAMFLDQIIHCVEMVSQ